MGKGQRKGGGGYGHGQGQGQGQWMFVPQGYNMQHVQQHMMKQYQQPSKGKGQCGDNSNNNPKTRLSQGLPLLLGRAATKDDCVYEMNEENGKYTAVLQIAALDRDSTDFVGKPAGSKKEAEQNAALQAVNVLAKDIKVAQQARGQVTKAADQQKHNASDANDSPKTRLSQGLPMLLGRAATKDDCVFETNEEDGKFKAVLRIATLDRETTDFVGKPANSKMEAMQNAALQALNVLGKDIEEAKAVHDEVKKAKKEEKNAANRERIEAKKAAKAAAEGGLA